MFWIDLCKLLQMPVVKWATMCVKAEKARSTLVQDAAYVPNAKLEGMVFSDEWLQKLQGRHG